MILLDTHIWLWTLNDPARLSASQNEAMKADDDLVVSAVSCWEVALLVSKNRITLDKPLSEWIRDATSRFGIRAVDLTPAVAVASTRLPGTFHADPADRFLVATARLRDCALVTSDRKILDYAHVRAVG